MLCALVCDLHKTHNCVNLKPISFPFKCGKVAGLNSRTQHLRFDVVGGSQGQKGKKKCHLDVLRPPGRPPAGRSSGGFEVSFQVKEMFLMFPFEQRPSLDQSSGVVQAKRLGVQFPGICSEAPQRPQARKCSQGLS